MINGKSGFTDKKSLAVFTQQPCQTCCSRRKKKVEPMTLTKALLAQLHGMQPLLKTNRLIKRVSSGAALPVETKCSKKYLWTIPNWFAWFRVLKPQSFQRLTDLKNVNLSSIVNNYTCAFHATFKWKSSVSVILLLCLMIQQVWHGCCVKTAKDFLSVNPLFPLIIFSLMAHFLSNWW